MTITNNSGLNAKPWCMPTSCSVETDISVYCACRFFSRVPLPPDFPGDPLLKISAKLKETFKGVRLDFEQRLRSEQGIVSKFCLLLA